MSNNSQTGYVALLAVLIVGAASTAIALTLLIIGIDSQRASLVSLRSVQARNLATTCAEEALQEIWDDADFAGTNNVNQGAGSCSYTVTDAGGADRTVTTTGTVDSVVRKLEVHVTIESLSISVTSWQEVI